MAETMDLMVLPLLIKRDQKTSTMRDYICTMRESHIAKGYSAAVLEEYNMVKAILKGSSNQEATSSKLSNQP